MRSRSNEIVRASAETSLEHGGRMSRRLRSRQLLSAVMTLASACTTFVPISPRVGLNQRELEVRFTTPRRLVARSHTGAEVVRRDVTRAVGRLLEVRDDTLRRWRGLWSAGAPDLGDHLPREHVLAQAAFPRIRAVARPRRRDCASGHLRGRLRHARTLSRVPGES